MVCQSLAGPVAFLAPRDSARRRAIVRLPAGGDLASRRGRARPPGPRASRCDRDTRSPPGPGAERQDRDERHDHQGRRRRQRAGRRAPSSADQVDQDPRKGEGGRVDHALPAEITLQVFMTASPLPARGPRAMPAPWRESALCSISRTSKSSREPRKTRSSTSPSSFRETSSYDCAGRYENGRSWFVCTRNPLSARIRTRVATVVYARSSPAVGQRVAHLGHRRLAPVPEHVHHLELPLRQLLGRRPRHDFPLSIVTLGSPKGATSR